MRACSTLDHPANFGDSINRLIKEILQLDADIGLQVWPCVLDMAHVDMYGGL
jgi:hypothetical protein